jgi:hypothetical protein
MQPDEEAELDPVVFGAPPARAARLGQPRPPARPRPRRKGPVEAGVASDLRQLPAPMRKGGIASAALRLARELDTLGLAPRDAAGHAREIRQSLVTLAEMAPGEGRGDRTDEIRDRRERNLRLRADAAE